MVQNLQQVGDVVLREKEDFKPWYKEKLKRARFIQIEDFISPEKTERIEDDKPQYPTC